MTHLRQRMIEDMGIRNLADNTQSAYLQQVIAYAAYFHRSPEELGPEAVRSYQLYLMNTRRLSPSSISVATGALRFLYKVTLKRDWAVDQIPMPKRPFKLPVILSREEVMHFLDSVDSLKHRTILMTAYAAGLRVSEAIHLKVTDIDSQPDIPHPCYPESAYKYLESAYKWTYRSPSRLSRWWWCSLQFSTTSRQLSINSTWIPAKN